MTDLVTKFVELTNCSSESAISYLDKFDWNFEEALQHYFDEGGKSLILNDDANEVKVVKTSHGSSTKEKDRGVITLDSILKSSQRTDDDENSQAFYAGGSEKSGQLILGPASMKNKKDLDKVVENIFKSAIKHGAKEIQTNPNLLKEKISKAKKGKKHFGGKGHVLGHTSGGTVHVDSTTSTEGEDSEDEGILSSSWGGREGCCASRSSSISHGVVLRLFSDGFTLDDGPLRSFADPENSEFLDAILRSELPPEIANMKSSASGEPVNLVMEDHRNEKFLETSFGQKAKPVKPFGGQGYMLGSPSPGVKCDDVNVAGILKSSGGGSTPQASTSRDSTVQGNTSDGLVPMPGLDNASPTTIIQVRLADGSKISLKCNTTQTVGNIREAIKKLYPTYGETNFKLLITFPHKELTDDSVTLEQANLLNTVIIQKLK